MPGLPSRAGGSSDRQPRGKESHASYRRFAKITEERGRVAASQAGPSEAALRADMADVTS
jgi:hypothetical protein